MCWGVGGRCEKVGGVGKYGKVWESVLGVGKVKRSVEKCVGVWGR